MYTTEITFTHGTVVHRSFENLEDATEFAFFVTSRLVAYFGAVQSVNIENKAD